MAPQIHIFEKERASRSEKSGVPDAPISRGFGQLREISPSFFPQVIENNTGYAGLQRFHL
jgi:hypothetical protein